MRRWWAGGPTSGRSGLGCPACAAAFRRAQSSAFKLSMWFSAAAVATAHCQATPEQAASLATMAACTGAACAATAFLGAAAKGRVLPKKERPCCRDIAAAILPVPCNEGCVLPGAGGGAQRGMSMEAPGVLVADRMHSMAGFSERPHGFCAFGNALHIL